MTLRYRGVWLAIGWMLVIAVVYFSLTPQPPPSGLAFHDKLQHLLAYAVLMVWWGQLLRDPWRLALMLVLLGLGLELLQSQTDYRRGDIFDMAANTLGVGLGSLIGVLMPNWLARLERRARP